MERGPAAFDRFARDWDDLHGPDSPRAAEFHARIRLLRRLLRHPQGARARMLELGCGTGLNLVALADRLVEGVGVDFSPSMIAQARRNAGRARARNLRFVLGDAADAPLAGTFDLVLLAGTLEHLPDRDAVLGRCRTLLAPTGRVVVVAPHPRSPALLWQRLVRGGRSPSWAGRQFAEDLHMAPRGLEALARRHGLAPAGLHALPCRPAHDGERPPPGWARGLMGAAALLPMPAARGAFALVLEKG